MNITTRHKVLHTALTVTAALLFAACTDTTESNGWPADGKLHFKLSQSNTWDEGGQQTRLASPIALSGSGVAAKGETLYLYCMESNTIDTDVQSVVTRGQRLTGEVFAPDGGINTFALWAKTANNDEVRFGADEYEAAAPILKAQRDQLTKDGSWYYMDQVLNFPGDETSWPVTFYGVAPTTDEAECITIDGNSLNFTMKEDEKDNKDILVAQKTVETGDVELRFHHVLSALKFKFADADAAKAKIDDKEYTIVPKSVKLDGIYFNGTTPIAEKLADISWTPLPIAGQWTDHCIINTMNGDIDDNESDKYNFINTDEHCLMVLPQTAPEGAKLIIICDLVNETDEETTTLSDVEYSASLEGLEWKPGYSYTYKLSKWELDYEFKTDLDNNFAATAATTYNHTGIGVNGGNINFQVKSSKTEHSNGVDTPLPASWHLEYSSDGVNWTHGLPATYELLKNDQVVYDLENIEGSTEDDGATYTLRVGRRYDGWTPLTEMQKDKYGTNCTADNGESYYDLSMVNGSRNTANCYVIHAYGRFLFPLVYGPAIKNGAYNSASYTPTYPSVGPETTVLHNCFYNYKNNNIEDPYILEDTKVAYNNISASIVWEDDYELVKRGSVKIVKDEEDNACIAFEIEKEHVKPGNVILAVKDVNGDIMWSWHIWITDLDTETPTNRSWGGGTVGFMKYNLGWREPTNYTVTGNLVYQIKAVQNHTNSSEEAQITQTGGEQATIYGSNLYYQWGRKDPIPGAYLDGGVVTHMENRLRELGYEWGVVQARVGMDVAIKNPNKFYRNDYWDWMVPKGGHANTNMPGNYTTSDINLRTALLKEGYYYGVARWNPTFTRSTTNYERPIKTVYDPCPYGYVVPNRAAEYAIHAISTNVSIDQTTYENDLFTYKAGGLEIPMTGIRERTTNDGRCTKTNDYGYMWISYSAYESNTGNAPYLVCITGAHATIRYYDNGRWRSGEVGSMSYNNKVRAPDAIPVRPIRDYEAYE